MRKELSVMGSLFSADPERRCDCCAHGRAFQEGERILCRHKGIMEPGSQCAKFRYDPLRRKPRRAPTLPEYSSEDFKL